MQRKIKNLVRLMHFIMKLKRVALHSNKTRPIEWSSSSVPCDVDEGHFAVLACDGEEKKRFVVGLSHLRNPGFVRLLEMAREEYGFANNGLLVVPCLPGELEKILKEEDDSC